MHTALKTNWRLTIDDMCGEKGEIRKEKSEKDGCLASKKYNPKSEFWSKKTITDIVLAAKDTCAVMIFQYLGNGGRLAVNGERINGERWADERWGVSESAIWLPYLDEPQRIITFGHLSKDLFALWFGGEFQDVGDTQSCSRIIPPRTICSQV